MANFIWKDFVKQTVSAVASSGTGAFTLSSAVSGFQALAAGDDGNIGYFTASEGTKWQTFIGTYTSSGTSLARTVAIDGSAGAGANETFTTAAVVFLDVSSRAAQAEHNLERGRIYGMNLTFTSINAFGAGAGCAYIESSYNAPIATSALADLTGLSLTASHFYNAYGYLSSGVWTLDTPQDAGTAGSTNTPVAFAIPAGSARSKPSDTTRRYLGTILATGAGAVRSFQMTDLGGGWCELIYLLDTTATAPFLLVNGGTATVYTAVDCSALIPNNGTATHAMISGGPYINSGSSAPSYCWLSVDAIGYTQLIYNQSSSAGIQSAVPTWMPINPTTTAGFYYKTQTNQAVLLYCWGYRFKR